MSATSLQECFQHYFIQSQQIPTIVMLCSTTINNKIESAALLLQRMPCSPDIDVEDANNIWHEASCLAATIKQHELLSSGPPMEQLIRLVFDGLTWIVSRETTMSFQCTCSHKKIVNIIKSFDSKNNDNEIEVICEYCNKKYTIDKTEIDS